MEYYTPLHVETMSIFGFRESMEAMRLPKGTKSDTTRERVGPDDLRIARGLVNAGDDHAKAMRGVNVYLRMEMQAGFMIEFETYRHGVECLSTSSTMHNELKNLSGEELAEQKQKGLSTKVYERITMVNYQTLRRIYRARRHHRHPDWAIFCDMVETLPYFDSLIYPEGGANG